MQHPEDIARLFVEAWNGKDAERLASLFSEDAEFVNVTGLWWHNRQSIQKAHQYGFENIFQQAIAKLKRTKVKLLTDGIAVVHAKMELTGQTMVADVRDPENRQNIFSFVMQQRSGGWICVSAHNTDILRGMETIVRDEEGNVRGVNYRM